MIRRHSRIFEKVHTSSVTGRCETHANEKGNYVEYFLQTLK